MLMVFLKIINYELQKIKELKNLNKQNCAKIIVVKLYEYKIKLF